MTPEMLNQFLATNPAIANNPANKQIIDAIRNNDVNAGRRIAENYIKSLGMDWNTALQQAGAYIQNLQQNNNQQQYQGGTQ